MLHFNVRRQLLRIMSRPIGNQSGFTLIEVLVVMIIVGILSAISAPTFGSMLNRNRISNATIRLKSALVEAQTNTTRRGKPCKVIINSGSTPSLSSGNPANITATTVSSYSCWSTQVDTFSDVQFTIVDSANTPPSALPIIFDFKGRVTTGNAASGGLDTRAIVVSSTASPYKKCVMISYPLGIVRTGEYIGTSCKISP